MYMVKDKTERILEARKRLAQQLPDPALALAGSLMKRMIRCNKPGCRYCEKDKGKGHGPIWILSVGAGNRRVRQIPVPTLLKQESRGGRPSLCRDSGRPETDLRPERGSV